MTIQQLRTAEHAYIFHNTLLAEISQTINISQDELTPYHDEWEHRRQAYRTAEYLFCRHEYTLEELTEIVPLTLEELKDYADVLEHKRAAYLSAAPTPFLQVNALLHERVNELTRHPVPLISTGCIQKLYNDLKPSANLLDHYELLLSLFLSHFLPARQLDRAEEEAILTVLKEFRGFLKMQLLSGNR